MNLPHVFLEVTQGKRRINRTFSDISKRTVNAGFTWYSPFGKIDGERGFSCRVTDVFKQDFQQKKNCPNFVAFDL